MTVGGPLLPVSVSYTEEDLVRTGLRLIVDPIYSFSLTASTTVSYFSSETSFFPLCISLTINDTRSVTVGKQTQ